MAIFTEIYESNVESIRSVCEDRTDYYLNLRFTKYNIIITIDPIPK